MRRIEPVVHIFKVKEQPNDYKFWQGKSAIERLEALESLRQQFYLQSDGTRSRFQRVYRIIKQTRY